MARKVEKQAREKAASVIQDLRTVKLTEAAKEVEDGIEETLTYADKWDIHLLQLCMNILPHQAFRYENTLRIYSRSIRTVQNSKGISTGYLNLKKSAVASEARDRALYTNITVSGQVSSI